MVNNHASQKKLPGCVFLTIISLIGFSSQLNAQCSGLGSVTLNIVPAPQPTLTYDNQICAGGNTSISVDQVFDSYTWSNSQSGQSITVSNTGTYTVTVTNSGGCSATATATVSLLPALSFNATMAPYACNGTRTINASGNFPDYAWSTGETGPVITVGSPGTYTVTATNAAGCTGTTTVNVTIPAMPVVAINGNSVLCTGSNTVLSATSGFTSYSWSGGGNSASFSATTPGVYTVTVTNAAGCTATDEFDITGVPAPVPTLDATTPVCAGNTATLSVNNGPFVQYNWTGGGNTASITVMAAGNYTVTVTDNNGCTGTSSATQVVNPNPTATINASPYACNGTLVLNAPAGLADYQWSTSGTSNSTTISSNGIYSVTVTNNNGCTSAVSGNFVIPPPVTVTISGNSALCQGGSQTLNATTGYTSYTWSGGTGNGAIRTITASGTYTVTATDSNGCTNTASFSVGSLPVPAPVIDGPISVCSGNSASLTIQNGPFSDYDWSTGSSNPAITVSNAGTYTVTVTNSDGCTGTDTATLAVIGLPPANIVVQPYACNGQITLNASPGQFGYSWSNAANTSTTTVSSSGDYTVTITNSQGCTRTASAFADIPQPPTVSVNGPANACEGNSAVLTASSGFAQYIWSNSQSTPSITVTGTGTYIVTVTDDFGCTAENDFSIIFNDGPQPQITGPTSICNGSTATLTANGAGFISYFWSTGANTPSITTNTPGTYEVFVTDGNGCTGTAATTLNISNSLSLSIIQQPYNCSGQIVLDAGSGFSTYAWSIGGNNATLSVNTSGTYTVTVSDVSGCTGTASRNISIPAPPVVNISGPAAFCTGGNAQLVADAGFNQYLWSNGQLNASINVSQGNTYTVTATDNNGCTTTDTFILSENTNPQPVLTGPQTICANGSVSLTVSGAFQAYLWSNGASTASITTNTPGPVTVTVTDQNGCTGADTINLTLVNSLNPALAVQPYTCNGQMTLTSAPGFQNYTWNNSGSSSNILTVNQSGTYTVTVSDASGCTGTAEQNIQIPAAPVVSISGATPTCAGATATLSASAGLTSYLWSNSATTTDITVTQSGNYTVTVTDALGCTTNTSVNLIVNPLPQPQIAGSTTLCNGSAVSLSVPGNFGAFLWNTGATTSAISINAPGPVTVTVTDQNGCTNADTINLTLSNSLSPNLTAQPYTCNGQITLVTDSGFQNYTWSNSTATGNSLTVNQSGTYTVTVSDANGCTGTVAQNVQIPAAPVVSITGVNAICAGATATLSASAGLASYVWSNSATTASITTAQSGNYTVTVTDALGCTTSTSVNLIVNPLPQPQIAGSTTICNGSAVSLSVAGSFGAFLWNTGATTSAISVNAPGPVTVTVTDQNGCSGSNTINLTLSNSLSPNLTTQPYACNGQVTLVTDPGFQNYTWNNNGSVNNTLTVNQSGTYTVTVSDANGCTGTVAQNVQIPAAPVVSITGVNAICAGATATLSASAGLASYVWSNSATTASITTAQSGNYTVTVTDALGCTTSASVNLIVNPLPQPQIAGSTTLCNGSTVSLSVTGNFGSYLWSTGATTAATSVNAPGPVTVTVTDQNGCSGSNTINLTLSNSLSPNLTIQPYACNGQVTLVTDPGFQNYTWSNNGSGNNTLTVNQSGAYTVTVGDASGCTGTATVQATIPNQPAVAIQAPPSPVCEGSTATLTATATGAITYAWNNGNPTPTLDVQQSGQYSITITDQYGCSAADVIDYQLAALPVITSDASPINCSSPVAKLSVVSQGGGALTQYQWSDSSTGATLSTDVPGDYTVTVSNAEGCTATATASVAPFTPVQLQVSDTIEFKPGQVIPLNIPALGFIPANIVWTPDDILACNSCLANEARPVANVSVSFSATSSGDCFATGNFYLYKKDEYNIYIPNTFNPDSDNNNRFTVFSNDLGVKVDYLRVYTRWGELIQEIRNVQPNDTTRGWDGTFRGKNVEPGVYVYVIRLEMPDGSTRILDGDVTIIK